MSKDVASFPSAVRSLISLTGEKLAEVSGGTVDPSPLILADARTDFDACLLAVARALDALKGGEDALLSAKEGARGVLDAHSPGDVAAALDAFRQALTGLARFGEVKDAIDALGASQSAPGYVCARLPAFLTEEVDFFSASMYVELASVLLRQEWVLEDGSPDAHALDALINLVETTLLAVRSFSDDLARHQSHLSLRADFFTYLNELVANGETPPSDASSGFADTSVELPPEHPALRLF